MKGLRALAILAVLALYLGVGIFDHGLWRPTEPTVAGIVWNMLERHDWVVPRIDDMPYLEKPPFYYWLAGGASKLLGGPEPGALRLPATLLGLGCLAWIWATARRRYGEDVACVTLLLAATCGTFYDLAHRASTDIAATFFTISCFGIYARSLPDAGGSRPASTRGLDLLLAAVLAASFYAKNFYTALVVVPLLGGHLLWQREFRRAAILAASTLLFSAVLVTPWALAVRAAEGNGALRVVFVDNTIGRFFELRPWLHASGPLNDALYAEKKADRPFFYLRYLVAVCLPWLLVVGVGLLGLLRRRRSWDAYERFVALGFLAIPGVLTLSTSKVGDYVDPVLFVELLAAADVVARVLGRGEAFRGWERAALVANVAIAAAAIVVAPAGVAWVSKSVPAAGLAAVSLAGAVAWARRRTGGRWGAARLIGGGVGFVAVATLTLALAIPLIDAAMSTDAAMARCRADVGGRPVLTTYLEDHGLPYLTWGLRSFVRIASEGAIAGALRASAPVAAVIHDEQFEGARRRWGAIPGVRVSHCQQGEGMVLLRNGFAS